MEKRYIRLIPRLDIKGPNLVKGIRLEGLRVLGDPDVFAKHYYNHGADELFYMDVVASLYERNSLKGMISRVAGNVFMTLLGVTAFAPVFSPRRRVGCWRSRPMGAEMVPDCGDKRP